MIVVKIFVSYISYRPSDHQIVACCNPSIHALYFYGAYFFDVLCRLFHVHERLRLSSSHIPRSVWESYYRIEVNKTHEKISCQFICVYISCCPVSCRVARAVESNGGACCMQKWSSESSSRRQKTRHAIIFVAVFSKKFLLHIDVLLFYHLSTYRHLLSISFDIPWNPVDAGSFSVCLRNALGWSI